MSNKEEMKANAVEIQKGLKKLGANRVVALSVHKTKELVAELEGKIDRLVSQIDSLD